MNKKCIWLCQWEQKNNNYYPIPFVTSCQYNCEIQNFLFPEEQILDPNYEIFKESKVCPVCRREIEKNFYC